MVASCSARPVVQFQPTREEGYTLTPNGGNKEGRDWRSRPGVTTLVVTVMVASSDAERNNKTDETEKTETGAAAAERLEELQKAENDKKLRVKQARRELLLTYMNGRHAFIANYGNKVMVSDMQPDPLDPTRLRTTFVGLEAIRARYSNQLVPSPTVKDEEKSQELGVWWTKHPNRLEYAGVRFQPGADKVLWMGVGVYLNLWLGWGVQAKPGQWSLMREHIREVIAAGDPLMDDYIIRWCAWAVQHPDKQAEVALTLRGKKGTGKGTLTKVLMRIFGMHGKQISDREHLTGKHNAHLHDCILLIVDEAYWAGDRKGEGVFKRLITEDTLTIEPKFVDMFSVPNMLHIIITANEEWVVPASQDERRFVVGDVSEKRLGDYAYFVALNAEIDGGGVEAMLHDLLAMDLGEWHPRQVYRNEALRRQQAQSLRGVHGWYEHILQEGVLPDVAERGHRVRFSKLIESARHSDVSLRYITNKDFRDVLDSYGIKRAGRDGAGGLRRFPPLLEARSAFAERFGGWRWDNDFTEWTNEDKSLIC